MNENYIYLHRLLWWLKPVTSSLILLSLMAHLNNIIPDCMMLTLWKEPDVRFNMQQMKYNRGIQNCDYLKSVYFLKSGCSNTSLCTWRRPSCIKVSSQSCTKKTKQRQMPFISSLQESDLHFLLCKRRADATTILRDTTSTSIYVRFSFWHQSLTSFDQGDDAAVLIMFAGCCCTVWITH